MAFGGSCKEGIDLHEHITVKTRFLPASVKILCFALPVSLVLIQYNYVHFLTTDLSQSLVINNKTP